MKKLSVMLIITASILILSSCADNNNHVSPSSTTANENENLNSTLQPVDESSSSAHDEPVVLWETHPGRMEIGATNATLSLRAIIDGQSTMKITGVGIDLYDERGKHLASASEPAELYGNSHNLIIWYDMNTDLNYILESNTRYIFTMFVVIDDATYTSESHSFTTEADDSQILAEDDTFAIYAPTPIPTQMPVTPESAISRPPLLYGMEQNGQYNLTLYESGIQEVSDGTMVLADLMVPSTVTDEEAQNILAADSEANYYNGGSYEEIRYSGGFLIRSACDSLWNRSSSSDVIELEVFSSGKVFIPYNAQFTDNMTSIMFGSIRNVSSLNELFHVSLMGMEFNYSSIEVQVTVSDGMITVVDMYYTP